MRRSSEASRSFGPSPANSGFCGSVSARGIAGGSREWPPRAHRQSRLCVRSVLCCSAFPLVSGLRSTDSAAGRPALFVGFIALCQSRLLPVVHRRLRLLAFPPHASRSEERMTDQGIARFPCKGRPYIQGLRPRRIERMLAPSHPTVSPPVYGYGTTSASGRTYLYRGRNGHC